MGSLKCFKEPINLKLLDREPFKFNHQLLGHPALSLESLAKIIPELSSEKVMYSKGLNDLSVNFDDALNEENKEKNFSEVIDSIRTTNSYIALRNLENHKAFKDLYKDLMVDVSGLLMSNGTGTSPLEPMLWIFIASPNAVTPFHFDRTSNFLMQIRGSKEVAIFPPRIEEIISAKNTEAYLDWSGGLPPWKQELDVHANKFQFNSGEAIHIPYVSGHYVKNGAEDISISLSFLFHSEETLRWSNAMKLNNRLRRLGLNPSPIGFSPRVDSFKASMFPAVSRAFSAAGKIRGK
ncbi:MAG: cupin-like domain-containing protein [Bacteriovorax sp.]|nr:cupin-like domain-containing protein [Bacteriovorax sp.]